MKSKRNLDHVPSKIILGFVYDDLFIGVLFQMKNCLLVLSLLESTISVIRKSFQILRQLSSAKRPGQVYSRIFASLLSHLYLVQVSRVNFGWSNFIYSGNIVHVVLTHVHSPMLTLRYYTYNQTILPKHQNFFWSNAAWW